MNRITKDLLSKKLDELNSYPYYCKTGYGIFEAIQTCFNIDPKCINCQINWSGDFSVKFESLYVKIESSDTKYLERTIPRPQWETDTYIIPLEYAQSNDITVKYRDGNDELKFLIRKNHQATMDRMTAKRGQNVDNVKAQRNFMELIAVLYYIKDKKIRGSQWLPEFAKDVSWWLADYEIYVDAVE